MVGVAVGVTVAVAVGVGVATTSPYSNAPISQSVYVGAGRGKPRWSVVTVQLAGGTAAIA